MTDREKLIALLGQYARCDEFGVESCDTCRYRHEANCNVQLIADHFLANGVTFATGTNDGGKWIRVEDRLPEEGVVVMCRHKAREYPLFLSWNESDLCWEDSAWIYGAGLITHWMPLPEPPKEE